MRMYDIVRRTERYEAWTMTMTETAKISEYFVKVDMWSS